MLSEVETMKSFSDIKKDPRVCGGDACIRNTRIPVWSLVSYRKLGSTDEELLKVYPNLTLADLQAAWDYFAINGSEIDATIRENDEAMHGSSL